MHSAQEFSVSVNIFQMSLIKSSGNSGVNAIATAFVTFLLSRMNGSWQVYAVSAQTDLVFGMCHTDSQIREFTCANLQ
jgi:hypothetical protein